MGIYWKYDLWLYVVDNPQTYRLMMKVSPSMRESEVRRLLGTPTFEYSRVSAPAFYYVEGYNYKRREINFRVLIYVVDDVIGYFYIDRDGLVEDVYVGGS